MVVQVKVCGITTADALAAAATADWVGFNFVPASPRVIAPAHAAALSREGPCGPARVGLFVDPDDDEVAAVLAVLPLDAIQLYAGADRRHHLARRFGVPVWEPVGVAAAGDLPAAPAVRYLLEAKPPPGAAIPGGNATTFDWTMLRGWAAPAPWMLAGGLSPGNVADAIARSGASAVDVSSGVESRRGVKDPALIRAFIAAARGG